MVEFHRLQVPLDCHSCGFMKKLSVTCGGASCTQEISLAKSLDARVIKNIFTVSIGFDAFCLPSNTSFCCAMHPSSHSLMWQWQVSVGYFISDLGMIIWFYPSLGGMEYVSTNSFVQRLIKPNTSCFHLSSISIFVSLQAQPIWWDMSTLKFSLNLELIMETIITSQVIHHFFSMIAVAYSMLTGEGQLYTCMVLISETTTPGINLRW